MIALAGFLFGILPVGISLEEEYGLSLLFRLRGPRSSPSDVVVVNIDKKTSDSLGLKNDPRKWPRTLHAELINRLVSDGAKGIVFDMFFEEARPGNEDRIFADAIRSSEKVVLCQRLESERRTTGNGVDIYSEHLVPPLPLIGDAALALAPFPLPKVPKSIIRSWTFKAGSGDMPTLPAISFQLYALDVYDELLLLMRRAGADLPDKVPSSHEAASRPGAIVDAVQEIRQAFENTPHLAEKIYEAMNSSHKGDDKNAAMLRSLVSMYSGDARRYLNFYGPPGTVTTVPYDRMIDRGDNDNKPPLSIKDKMVFVGFSELYQPEQKDTFYTVFSEEDGRDISGIELAATGFSNLLEQMPVRPPGFIAYASILILWGLAVGAACRHFPTLISIAIAAFAGMFYLLFAYLKFRASGIWIPVTVPVFLQPSLAFFGSLIWKYADVSRERRNIRNAFGFYLPPDVVDRLAKNMSGIRTDSRVVQGVCLYTDAEGYTSLAETMDSDKLGQHMNRYYEMVFRPIRELGGMISNVVGDSVLALWIGAEADKKRLISACNAALQISRQMQSFEDSVSGSCQLPTRIGIHAGQIMLGNIGAADHFEYRPVGDIVNAATRLDSLNRLLATRILISESVAEDLEGFVLREMGSFLMKGKAKPINVFELISEAGNAPDNSRQACEEFSSALAYFRQGQWQEAKTGFSAYRRKYGEDGPARFYLDLCSRYIANPPEGQWDGVIRMDMK